MQLRDRHVLVTGGSRGIGAALVRRALQRGARVTVVSRSAPLDPDAAHVPADLSRAEDVEGLVDRVEKEHGPVDVLALNAGTDATAALVRATAEDLRRVVDVNLVAPMELVRQALPRLTTREAHVLLTSSGYGSVAAPGLAAYCATKAGLSHFSSALRMELAGTRVGLTVVEPGPVRTTLLSAIETDRASDAALHRLLRLRLVRVVEPDEVAERAWSAVERGRRTVAVPRRVASATSLPWLARRVAELALTGTPRR
jgi:uncharacterized protein